MDKLKANFKQKSLIEVRNEINTQTSKLEIKDQDFILLLSADFRNDLFRFIVGLDIMKIKQNYTQICKDLISKSTLGSKLMIQAIHRCYKDLFFCLLKGDTQSVYQQVFEKFDHKNPSFLWICLQQKAHPKKIQGISI